MTVYYKAIDLQGSGDYITIDSAPANTLTTYMSYVIWAHTGSITNAGMRIGGKGWIAPNKTWLLLTQPYGATTRGIGLFMSSNGTADTKHWSSTVNAWAASTWDMFTISFAAGTVQVTCGGAAISSWNYVANGAMGALHASTAALEIGNSAGTALVAPVMNMSLWGGTGALSLADISTLYAGGPAYNPRLLTPSAGAVLVDHRMLEASITHPSVPDHVGDVPGTMVGMGQGNVIDSPYTGPWNGISRPWVRNRATKTSTGARASWASPGTAVDDTMAYDPQQRSPSAHGDFVVLR